MAEDAGSVGTRDSFAFDNYELKLWRKLFHVSSSWIGFVYLYSGIPHATAVIGLGLIVAALFALDVARFRSGRFAGWFTRLFGPLTIARDHGRFNSASWYGLAVFLGMLLFGGERPEARLVVAVPIFYLAFGDTAASIIGKRFGRARMPFLKGSWPGTIACFAACLVVNLVFLPSLSTGLLVAVIAAVAEGLPVAADDNLSLMLIPAAALYWIG